MGELDRQRLQGGKKHVMLELRQAAWPEREHARTLA